VTESGTRKKMGMVRRCVHEAITRSGSDRISLTDLSRTDTGAFVARFDIRGDARTLRDEPMLLFIERWASDSRIVEYVLQRIREAIPVWLEEADREK
jgi:hypothetical protein